MNLPHLALFADGKIVGAIGVGVTEAQDCEIAEHVVRVFEGLVRSNYKIGHGCHGHIIIVCKFLKDLSLPHHPHHLHYTMCRHHAELLNELTMALDMIPSGSSPSIMTARKNIVREMN